MRLLAFAAALLLMAAPAAHAEDGYDLWLRYKPVEASAKAPYAARAAAIAPTANTPTLKVARAELERGLTGLVGTPATAAAGSRDGVIQLTVAPQQGLSDEGYRIRTTAVNGKKTTVIAASKDIGVLYGVFRYLELIQTRQPVEALDIASSPKVKLRMLNHWDNLNRTVERGYAGQSIFDWWRLPGHVDPRMVDYARANASIGINGTVLNNVNAKADSLTPAYIAKAAALADTFRPYGIRVYLSARWSAPVELGGLKTADPLDPAVAAFWKAKADEIYKAIPDFGGFLVKANSEGQPGPQDYGRTHVDGANMLADAPSRATTSSSRSTASSATTWSSRSRTARSTSSRASRSIRCSEPCRSPTSAWNSRSPRNISGSRPTSSISARCTKRPCAPTRWPRARARPWPRWSTASWTVAS